METRTAEVIVKVFAVLAWINAFFSLILALGLLAFGGMGSMMAADPTGAAVLAGLGIAGAILLLIFAVLYGFVGWGLWNRQNWARITVIVLAALGILMSLFSIAASPVAAIIGIIIEGIIIWLFAFEETVKGLFGKTAAPAKPAVAAKPAAAPKRKVAKKKR